MSKYVSSLILGGALAAAGVLPALAQAPGGPSPAGAGASAPVSAADVALPGDMMGTGQRMGPPPGARAGGPPPGGGGMREPGTNAAGPPMALALKAAQAAIDACKAQGYNIGVAVIDTAGQPRVGLSEDGANGGHIYTAVRKDLTALAFGKPSGDVTPGTPGVTPKMATMAGAIPLYSSSGKLLGAIAGSGAASSKDAECAQAGANAIKGEL